MLNIVLLEPEIPYNTGNIGRTCVTTGSSLHLIKPLGFDIDEKAVRRAGLDYWKEIDLHIYDSYIDFLTKNNNPKVVMATTKARKTYSDYLYSGDEFIMFGKESAGIPEELLVNNEENCVRIPMIRGKRSLNLSNSVSIILYEALRQNEFYNLEEEGNLHRLSWRIRDRV